MTTAIASPALKGRAQFIQPLRGRRKEDTLLLQMLEKSAKEEAGQ
jgi:hypothetical protein